MNVCNHNFGTGEKITWCPGCFNSSILLSLKKALHDLAVEGVIDPMKVVLVADIGCGGKIYDYIETSAVYALHGRVIPTATGVKIGNPDLTVIGFAGDGGTYNEGLGHFLQASRLNPDVTMIIANNGVFALTKGQPTATGDLSGRTVNPLSLAYEAGASFLARGSSFDPIGLSVMIKRAILHKGFSVLDIIQPCIIFNDNTVDLRKKIKPFNGSDSTRDALRDSNSSGEIRTGVIFEAGSSLEK